MLDIKKGDIIEDYKYGNNKYDELRDEFENKFNGLKNIHENILDILKRFYAVCATINVKPVI
jgi:hypothetical protein